LACGWNRKHVEPGQELQNVAAEFRGLNRSKFLPVTLDQDGAVSRVRLDGEVELKRLFVDALASGRELRVRLEGATALDIAIFQLLWVAQREAARAGMEFSVEGQVPEEIVRAMAEAGLDAFSGGPG
jgi:hypothetical protein